MSVPQLDSAFGRASSSKDHAHTLSGLAGSLPPFRSVPPDRTSERISHHLDTFLRSQGNAAGSRQTSTSRAGYRISGGRTGRSPCLTQMSLLVCRFHHVAGTVGPMRLPCFLDSTGTRRHYRFKLSARLDASQALPWVTVALARPVYRTSCIRPRPASRQAITQPS